MTETSPKMKEYFDGINKEIDKALKTANKARSKQLDPEKKVEINLAKNMAERVEGLISVLAPQIKGSGVVERIMELEKKYGTLDWRVALKIAEEVAQEKFCKFKNKIEAIEIGIRTGFAYVTVGVVSSPLDGLVGINIKKRKDGKEYICVKYAGPIRNAGGTAAAVSAIITDYIRQKQGYEKYDAQPEEIRRAITELQDYHERVTNLQYKPSEAEIDFLMKNIPIEISGDPSEQIEVSNYKDLERVETNFIRSGYCLMLSSCIPLKAPKLWKQLGKWGNEFGIKSWNFLEEFIEIQKKSKAKKKEIKTEKISPDYTYITDLVAGRPVLGYPLREGGFRLRYGRNRISGYSCQSIHPATMHILNKYIATGTQLKTERPGKATTITPCDTIEGPIVKLQNGTVLQINSIEEAKKYNKEIQKILFLGDILISYGDFYNRAHTLIPCGYCEEWWSQEVNQKTKEEQSKKLEQYTTKPYKKPTAQQAIQIAKQTQTPLHPAYTYHWKLINKKQLIELIQWLKQAKIYKTETKTEKIVLPKNNAKEILELIGLPHKFINNEYTILEEQEAEIINAMFKLTEPEETIKKIENTQEDTLKIINQISPIQIRDKSGTFIGTRMGRPEKAKQRKLTGNPHVLFPVGKEGGRLRSFQSALEQGKITAEFPFYYCEKCQKQTIFPKCENCGEPTKQKWKCPKCGLQDEKKCTQHGQNKASEQKTIPIKEYFEKILKYLGTKTYPELIKGVRGTSNKEHIPEHLAKGILRAKYSIHVYKDGTTRYDM
ncbi:DNA polymerase II large subunit, partial [Candidatus Woesearchaeota archaeon]